MGDYTLDQAKRAGWQLLGAAGAVILIQLFEMLRGVIKD